MSIDYNRRHMPSWLRSTEDPAGILLYYDADGTRARKASPNAETLYLDDFYSRSAVPSTSGYSERLVVSTGGHSVAEVVRESGGAPTTTYLHEDRLGSVEVVTDDSGAVLERRDYEAFGKRRSVTGPGANTRGDFTGHELDAEFGLINMKARLYDPAIGRFVMPDPIIDQPWHSEGPNAYSYVGNNPVNRIDPSGLQAMPGEDLMGTPCDESSPGCRSPNSGFLTVIAAAGVVVGAGASNVGLDIAAAGLSLVPGKGTDALGGPHGLSGLVQGLAAAAPEAGVAIALYELGTDIFASSASAPLHASARAFDARTEISTAVAPHAAGGRVAQSSPGNLSAESASGRVARMQAEQYGSVTARDPGLTERFFGVQPWQRLDATMMDWFDWGTARTLDLLMAGVIGPEEAAARGAGEGIRVTEKGLDIVKNHLAQFGEHGPNQAMIDRLGNAVGSRVTGADANFYLHEVSEATMMGRGMSYEAAHAAAIEKYGISPFSLYHPEIIQQFPAEFNNAWRAFWGIH